MEWLSAIRTAIDYMEKHLADDISAQDVADEVFLSPFFLQRGFSLMTGYGIGEYIRNRRLYNLVIRYITYNHTAHVNCHVIANACSICDCYRHKQLCIVSYFAIST